MPKTKLSTWLHTLEVREKMRFIYLGELTL